MAKYPNFGQTRKFWSNTEILVKNFSKKSNFWASIDILVKNGNICQISKCWSKLEILVKYPNFSIKSKFWMNNISLQNILLGLSLCKLRTDLGEPICCDGVNLKCYGCNPRMKSLGTVRIASFENRFFLNLKKIFS